MIKPLSEQLSDLSEHAKSAEDAIAAARKEAHDKVTERRAQTHAAAEAAIEKVNKDIKSVGDAASRTWTGFQTKINADVEALKAGIAQRTHERDVRRAQNQAEKLENEAAFAIDYAVASIEQAKLAVLDAMIGRMEVEGAKRAS
jgi:vacuolar-type H+-ATPase subunit I/STV1